jgi:hypothetical protein
MNIDFKIVGLAGLILLGCNKATTTNTGEDIDTVNLSDQSIPTEGGTMNKEITEKADISLDGVWTDGSGPNASFGIEKDSIRDVEHFTTSKMYRRGDTASVYYPDDTLTALIYKIHIDTLVYEYYGQRTKYWRFRD